MEISDRLGGAPAPGSGREEQMRRIEGYEAMLSELRQALSSPGLPEELPALREKARLLGEYYGSETWKRDYADDEAGRLPDGLRRGVLSEDGIYNALEELQERLAETEEGAEFSPVNGT